MHKSEVIKYLPLEWRQINGSFQTANRLDLHKQKTHLKFDLEMVVQNESKS